MRFEAREQGEQWGMVRSAADEGLWWRALMLAGAVAEDEVREEMLHYVEQVAKRSEGARCEYLHALAYIAFDPEYYGDDGAADGWVVMESNDPSLILIFHRLIAPDRAISVPVHNAISAGEDAPDWRARIEPVIREQLAMVSAGYEAPRVVDVDWGARKTPLYIGYETAAVWTHGDAHRVISPYPLHNLNIAAVLRKATQAWHHQCGLNMPQMNADELRDIYARCRLDLGMGRGRVYELMEVEPKEWADLLTGVASIDDDIAARAWCLDMGIDTPDQMHAKRRDSRASSRRTEHVTHTAAGPIVAGAPVTIGPHGGIVHAVASMPMQDSFMARQLRARCGDHARAADTVGDILRAGGATPINATKLRQLGMDGIETALRDGEGYDQYRALRDRAPFTREQVEQYTAPSPIADLRAWHVNNVTATLDGEPIAVLNFEMDGQMLWPSPTPPLLDEHAINARLAQHGLTVTPPAHYTGDDIKDALSKAPRKTNRRKP